MFGVNNDTSPKSTKPPEKVKVVLVGIYAIINHVRGGRVHTSTDSFIVIKFIYSVSDMQVRNLYQEPLSVVCFCDFSL